MSATTEMITLLIDDGQVEFQMEKKLALMSETIQNTIEDLGELGEGMFVPLPNVSSKTMQKVVDYYQYHYDEICEKQIKDRKEEEEEQERQQRIEKGEDVPILEAKTFQPCSYRCDWDIEFCKMEPEDFLALLNGADYLAMKDLRHLLCKTTALMIQGKTSKEIREIFNIETTLTEEQEQAILKQVDEEMEQEEKEREEKEAEERKQKQEELRKKYEEEEKQKADQSADDNDDGDQMDDNSMEED